MIKQNVILSLFLVAAVNFVVASESKLDEEEAMQLITSIAVNKDTKSELFKFEKDHMIPHFMKICKERDFDRFKEEYIIMYKQFEKSTLMLQALEEYRNINKK